MTTLPNQTPFYGGGQVPNPANVKPTLGAPPSTLTEDRLGTLAVDNTNAAVYGLVSKSGGTDTWVALGGGALSLATLTGDTGTATPSAGNIKIAGTSGQITTAASGSTVTVSIPDSYTLGSTSGASQGILEAGTAGMLLTTTGIMELEAIGTFNIGVNSDSTAVNLATQAGAGVKTLTMGSTITTSTTTINCGTGGCSVGASANNHTTTIGSTSGTCETLVQSGSGGIVLAGTLNLVASGPQILFGSGAPSALTAPQGSLYINTTASTTTSRLYINTTGSTTWADFTTSS